MKHLSVKLNLPVEFINVTKINPLISRCEIKVCYVGQEPNRNRSVITKEVATEMANSLPGSPIVGFYNEDKKDFEEHNRELAYEDGELIFKDVTRPYGFVDLNAKVWFAKYLDDGEVEREYLVTEGYLWTGQYSEAKRIIEQGNNHSMELDDELTKGFWTNLSNSDNQFFIINEAIVSKLCILGEEEEPCFEGSQINEPALQFSFNKEFENQMLYMMNQITEILSKGGTDKMFTKYSVQIGDSLWTSLYSHVTEKYADHKIIGVYEEEEQKFAVLAFEDKYYRLSFSLVDEAVESFAELEEITDYVLDEEPQFSNEEIENFVANFGKTTNDNTDNSIEEEKCSECGKNPCECKKYNLEEIPEYVELQNKFSALETDFNLLTEEKAGMVTELESLRNFKAEIDKKAKKDMIESFCMLSKEDKQDVIDNIDTYSLEEIEAKLSVICVRKKVTFSQEEETKEQTPVTYSLSAEEEDNSLPAWVKAALNVAEKMN